MLFWFFIVLDVLYFCTFQAWTTFLLDANNSAVYKLEDFLLFSAKWRYSISFVHFTYLSCLWLYLKKWHFLPYPASVRCGSVPSFSLLVSLRMLVPCCYQCHWHCCLVHQDGGFLPFIQDGMIYRYHCPGGAGFMQMPLLCCVVRSTCKDQMQIHSHRHLRSWRNRVPGPTAKVTQLPVATGVSVIKRPESCVPAPLTPPGSLGLKAQLSQADAWIASTASIVPSVSPLRCISVYPLLDVQICELATIFMWWTETTVLHWVCFTECRLVERAKAALHSTMLLTSLSILSIFWISTVHIGINTLASQSTWL